MSPAKSVVKREASLTEAESPMKQALHSHREMGRRHGVCSPQASDC